MPPKTAVKGRSRSGFDRHSGFYRTSVSTDVSIVSLFLFYFIIILFCLEPLDFTLLYLSLSEQDLIGSPRDQSSSGVLCSLILS